MPIMLTAFKATSLRPLGSLALAAVERRLCLRIDRAYSPIKQNATLDRKKRLISGECPSLCRSGALLRTAIEIGQLFASGQSA
jgi:hypothetical protein